MQNLIEDYKKQIEESTKIIDSCTNAIKKIRLKNLPTNEYIRLTDEDVQIRKIEEAKKQILLKAIEDFNYLKYKYDIK